MIIDAEGIRIFYSAVCAWGGVGASDGFVIPVILLQGAALAGRSGTGQVS